MNIQHNTSNTFSIEALKQVPGLNVQLGLRYTANNPTLYCKMLDKLVTTHAGDVDSTQAALKEGDTKHAHRLVHTLKGLAGTVGAEALQEAARTAELTILNETWDELDQHLTQLNQTLLPLLEAIRQTGGAANEAEEAPASQTLQATPAKKLPVVLAVDDSTTNLETLQALLGGKYQLELALDGQRAIQQAIECKPDLILLDIMMPGIDGFEVCRQIKRQTGLNEVPIIFLSALDDIEEKVKAFRSGGVDFVTKPFQPEELMARVDTHLTMRSLQTELEAQNKRLDQQVRLRTRELAAAHNRLSIASQTKNEFLQLIAHELRTPANGVLGIAELAFENCPGDDEVMELKSMFCEARERMLGVLDDALMLAQVHVSHQKYKTEPIPLNELLNNAIRAVSFRATEIGVRFGPLPTIDLTIAGNEDLFQTALRSLFKTTMAFTANREEISVECTEYDERVTIHLRGRGKVLSPSAAAEFFNVYGTARNSTHAEPLGLKPAVAERIITLFGGNVLIRSLKPSGVELVITMAKQLQKPAPLAQPENVATPLKPAA